MSYAIDGTSITLTRGDTFKCKIDLNKDGEPYIPQVGDTLRFAVKHNTMNLDKSEYDASADNNDTLQFKVAITLDEPFTPGTYYGYDIINISADHVIIVTSSGEVSKLYVKLNGVWKEVTAAYKKINGSWVLQSDVTTVFNSNTKYRME